MRQEYAWCHYGFREAQSPIVDGVWRFDNAGLFGDIEETYQHLDML
jgi:hypothetical protein